MRIDFSQIDFSLMGGSARRFDSFYPRGANTATARNNRQQHLGSARQVNMISPPARYYGRFSEFYERYVEPNLPSPDRRELLRDGLVERETFGLINSYLSRPSS